MEDEKKTMKQRIGEWIDEHPDAVINIMIGAEWAYIAGVVVYTIGFAKGAKKMQNAILDSVDNMVEAGQLDIPFEGEKKAERFLNDVLLYVPEKKKDRRRKW